MGSEILGIEYVFPKKKVTNEDLSSQFPDYDFSKFQKKVGISERYVVEEETALDLAIGACEKLFERFDRSQIDFVLYCSQSPEYFLPSTACILQDKIGLGKNTGALDFNLGCSGYTYGISIAKSLIESGQCKNVLLVTSETYSKYINEKDMSNKAIFGDAASASIIGTSSESKIFDFLFGTDGSGYKKLIVKNGASKNSYNTNAEEKIYGSGNTYTDNDLFMDGPEIFNFTLESIPNFVEEVLAKNKVEKQDIHQFIYHQANAFLLDTLRKRSKIEKENFFINMHGGNTVSNTIPIALKEYSKTIEEKQKIALIGFGVGLSWSGGIIEINKEL
ncbi:ketoacyl-ACP synthase III [Chryseobacterium sp.]|uniref:ketoacyl-ACP synthase III n=1 Tax=Chryseobacterium sp. TaxID=1871047 RepID=UPI000ED369D5|nr:ketoacyl-ACP synthase III [Chryseobacterium sp.]HCA07570.1 3-oxoacyl-ACP synthase [Chryseobacterium sp.]